MMRAAMLVLVISGSLAACGPETKPAEAPAQAEAAAQPAAVAASAISVDVSAPTQSADGMKVTSPLEVTGVAPSNWYFEAVFPLKLLGPDGAVLAEAPAQAQTDWMVQGPVTFKGSLAFTVEKETLATLVLEEDMPGQDANGDDNPPRAVRIPIVLTPAH